MVPVQCPLEGITSPWPPELLCGSVQVSLSESFNADSPAAASGSAVPLSPGWQQLRGQEMRNHHPWGRIFAKKSQDPLYQLYSFRISLVVRQPLSFQTLEILFL